MKVIQNALYHSDSDNHGNYACAVFTRNNSTNNNNHTNNNLTNFSSQNGAPVLSYV
jgi:hypothetical protein